MTKKMSTNESKNKQLNSSDKNFTISMMKYKK